MALAAAIGIAALLIVLAGLVERGYLTRVWQRSSRLGRGRRFRA